jgi:acyl-CoA reductase-like NAD-dependent aldehyde dehydrogenase
MGSAPLDVRCNAIRAAWSCDTLDKAQTFIKGQGEQQSKLLLENYIGSTYSPSSSQHIDSIDPKTGKVFANIPTTSADDVEEALRAATVAFKTWSKTTAATRSKYLQRVAQLIRENRELLAVWESIDQGKTLARARIEVDRAESNFR